MTLWQKLWARIKSWLFIEEPKEAAEPESKTFEPIKLNPAGRFVQPAVLKRDVPAKSTDEILAEIRARKTDSSRSVQEQNRLARHHMMSTPEPVIVHHYHDPKPDNTAANLLMMSMLMNNNQPTVQVIEQPAQVEIIMPQVPQPVCEPVREEPIRYSRSEPVYCAPEPEPYRAPDPEPTYSSPEPSYTDTSSSDSSSSYSGD